MDRKKTPNLFKINDPNKGSKRKMQYDIYPVVNFYNTK